jgi:CXXX repeat modification system protein
MTEFNLTDAQVDEIRSLFARLTATKNLIKEFTSNDPAEALERVMKDLGETQYKYDKWFADRQTEFAILTTPNNKWNVDFDRKKLQLI